jgi:hypothetical protein
MEEGSGDSVEEIQLRLDAWDRLGRKEVLDLGGFHEAIGQYHWFGPAPRLQSTWSQAIRIVLGSCGMEPSRADVACYQANQFGRARGNTCILNLLPLPAPSPQHWIYADCSEIAWLSDRDSYRESILTRRVEYLSGQIETRNPRYVVFFGIAHREYWEEIAGHRFDLVAPGVFAATGDYTTFLIAKHPVAEGATDEYFHQLGQRLTRSNFGAHPSKNERRTSMPGRS